MHQNKVNFLAGSTNPAEEKKALDEVCDYLISLGKYISVDEAKKDAINRMNFFGELKDPSMKDASIERKSVHALIYGHELHDVIERNGGYLSSVNEYPSSAKEDMSGSFKKLCYLVQQERKLGRTREQIVEELIQCGLEESQACGIYDVIYNAHKKKIIARAVVSVVVIIIIIYVVNV